MRIDALLREKRRPTIETKLAGTVHRQRLSNARSLNDRLGQLPEITFGITYGR